MRNFRNYSLIVTLITLFSCLTASAKIIYGENGQNIIIDCTYHNLDLPDEDARDYRPEPAQIVFSKLLKGGWEVQFRFKDTKENILFDENVDEIEKISFPVEETEIKIFDTEVELRNKKKQTVDIYLDVFMDYLEIKGVFFTSDNVDWDYYDFDIELGHDLLSENENNLLVTSSFQYLVTQLVKPFSNNSTKHQKTSIFFEAASKYYKE